MLHVIYKQSQDDLHVHHNHHGSPLPLTRTDDPLVVCRVGAPFFRTVCSVSNETPSSIGRVYVGLSKGTNVALQHTQTVRQKYMNDTATYHCCLCFAAILSAFSKCKDAEACCAFCWTFACLVCIYMCDDIE